MAEASQGRGIGARLLHVTLDRLDALGAPSYLETLNPRSVPFYERLGYRIWRSEIEPITGAQYWLMGRLAATALSFYVQTLTFQVNGLCRRCQSEPATAMAEATAVADVTVC